MKTLIKIILKPIAIAVILPVNILLLVSAYTYTFYQWLYGTTDLDKEISAELISDYKRNIINLFTKL